ncbi:MAG: hypothetical protein RL307_596 [Pseudomonadota bacterium]|jgi:predicted Fe-S protein YdhL (DUF1289 family)
MNRHWHQQLSARWQQVQLMDTHEHPPSPCLSVCVMNPDAQTCHGCLRTLDEIARWGSASAEEQHAIWRSLGRRLTIHSTDQG